MEGNHKSCLISKRILTLRQLLFFSSWEVRQDIFCCNWKSGLNFVFFPGWKLCFASRKWRRAYRLDYCRNFKSGEPFPASYRLFGWRHQSLGFLRCRFASNNTYWSAYFSYMCPSEIPRTSFCFDSDEIRRDEKRTV